MPKSTVIKELANNTISLEVALNRLMLIASDISNEELKQWAQNELVGYSDRDELPAYRMTTGGYFRYSGINGNFTITKSPFPLNLISAEHQEAIKKVNFFEGITALEEMANEKSKGEPVRDLTFMAGEVFENSGGRIRCTSIQQVIPAQMYKDVLAKIKTKLIDIFIALEKRYGCLDSLDIDTSNIKKSEIQHINNQINCEIYNDDSVSLGDKNTLKKNSIVCSQTEDEQKKEKWYSKITWKLIVPIIVGVAIATIGFWLGFR